MKVVHSRERNERQDGKSRLGACGQQKKRAMGEVGGYYELLRGHGGVTYYSLHNLDWPWTF